MDFFDQGYVDINRIINKVGERYHDKVFVRSVNDNRNITFGQFSEQCNRLCGFLDSKGLGPHDRVILISPNCIEWLIVFFGVLKYGATIAPLYERYADETTEELIRRINPKIILFHQELADRLPLSGTGNGEWISFGQWDSKDFKSADLFALTAVFSSRYLARQELKPRPDGAIISTTSGTTQMPRCVFRNFQCFSYLARTSIRRWAITDKDVILEYRSFAWLSASGNIIPSALYTGATLVIAKKFSSSQFFSWLKQYGVTIAIGVPAVINMLLEKQAIVNKEDFPFLRFITSSSAPLHLRKQEEFEALYGIPIVQFMGMTEAGVIATVDPKDRKIGSPGRAVDDAEVSIVDEGGNILGPGEEGEIVCAGKHVGQYYILENDLHEVFAPGGRMRTGDVGYLDEDGFLFVTGRKKNVIIRGGINISPLHVDKVLLEYPGVAETATFGIPDAIFGEEVAALVVLKKGAMAGEQELQEHCRARLSRETVPKHILIVEEIPKSDRGKVAKQQLFDLYFSQQVIK